MHVYIYDDFLSNGKYDNLLAKIETRITDLGLNGKIIRLGVMKSLNSAVDNELKRGAKTITAVGNDATINKVLNAVILSEMNSGINYNVPIGIIPVGDKLNSISQRLGIKNGEYACDTLSARRVDKIDVIKANDYYFLSHAYIESKNTFIEIEGKYSIEIDENGQIEIINIPLGRNKEKHLPNDGLAELMITTQTKTGIFKTKTETNHSIFIIKKIIIANKNNPLLVDDSLNIKTPVEINVIKKRIGVIIGRERVF